MVITKRKPPAAEVIFSHHSQQVFLELKKQEEANRHLGSDTPILTCQLTKLILSENWLMELESILIDAIRKYQPSRLELNKVLGRSPLTRLASIQRLWALFIRQSPDSQLLLYFDHDDLQLADIRSLATSVEALHRLLPSQLIVLLPQEQEGIDEWDRIYSSISLEASPVSISIPDTLDNTPSPTHSPTYPSHLPSCSTDSAPPNNTGHLTIRDKPHPQSRGEQRLHKHLAADSELKGLFYFNQNVISTRRNSFCVDLLWLHGKLIVEVDGYRYHSDREQFRKDRHRDYELVLSGYRVLRLTDEEIQEDIVIAIEKIRDLVRFTQSNLR